jgi:hypothetical protein
MSATQRNGHEHAETRVRVLCPMYLPPALIPTARDRPGLENVNSLDAGPHLIARFASYRALVAGIAYPRQTYAPPNLIM